MYGDSSSTACTSRTPPSAGELVMPISEKNSLTGKFKGENAVVINESTSRKGGQNCQLYNMPLQS
jgi:hypothetical protein